MTIFGKALKAIAVILLIGVLMHIFILTLRLDTDDQKLRTGEITLEQAMSKAEIAHSLIRIALMLLSSLIVAGVAFIIDTNHILRDDTDDLPEQIPANNIESKRKKK